MTIRVRAAASVVLLVLAGTAALAQIRPGGQMRIILMVDSSSTIIPMITDFRAGLVAFLDTLPGEPEIAVISTGSQMRVRVEPTTDRLRLRAAATGFASAAGGESGGRRRSE